MMDRHAAYVVMTRHRESVHLYADHETFGDRHQLDRALSRDSRKDLARDYGASELERAAGRVVQWQEREQALVGQQNQLFVVRTYLQRAEGAAVDLAESRPVVERAAARVYARPDDAVRLMLADPRTAAERLAAGQVHAYGELLGRVRTLRGPDEKRLGAERAVPQLRSMIERHLQLENARDHAFEAAGRVGATLGQIQEQLTRVSATLQHVRAATGPAEKALAHVAERLGRAAVNTAIALLPKPLQVPLRAAAYAIGRVLDLGRDLGLGR